MISILFTYDINHNAHSVNLNYEGENEIKSEYWYMSSVKEN